MKRACKYLLYGTTSSKRKFWFQTDKRVPEAWKTLERILSGTHMEATMNGVHLSQCS